MKLKSIAAAAVLAVASLGAAAEQTVLVPVVTGGVATFENESFSGTSFTQVINFNNLTNGVYNIDGVMSAVYLTLTSVDLNGSFWDLASVNSGKFWFVSIEVSSATPRILTLTGSRSASANSSYTGSLTVTAVPEPESYALMLAGLGLIGTIALRRSKASQAT